MLSPFRRRSDGPRLLVSVRSEAEAVAAVAGGADIIDVKDPDRGSLGCPDAGIVEAIGATNGSSIDFPLTVALGECREWNEGGEFQLPERVSVAKLGLSGLGRCDDWIAEWLAVRRRFEAKRGADIGWVAVAYVDASQAASPAIEDVAAAAITTGCAGLLLDTFDKAGGRFFDCIDEQRLAELASAMHNEGRFLAAAGRLRLEDAARLAESEADVVAVRSAVCEGEDRRGAVSAERVAACRQALESSGAGRRRG